MMMKIFFCDAVCIMWC